MGVYDERVNATRHVCPGSRHVYLCPGGYECADSAKRRVCPASSYCPTGSKSHRTCDAAYPLASYRNICSKEGMAFPDYSMPTAVFYIVCISVVAILHVFPMIAAMGAKARTRQRPSLQAEQGQALETSDRVSSRVANSSSAMSASARIASALQWCCILEMRAHSYVVNLVTDNKSESGHQPIDVPLHSHYYGVCSSINLSRLVLYCSISSFVCVMMALAKLEPATFPAILLCVLAIYGCCGLCHIDLVSSLRKTDGEVVYTSMGCTQRANLLVCALFGLVFVIVFCVALGDDHRVFNLHKVCKAASTENSCVLRLQLCAQGISWEELSFLVCLGTCLITGLGALCLRHATACQACNCFDCCCCTAVEEEYKVHEQEVGSGAVTFSTLRIGDEQGVELSRMGGCAQSTGSDVVRSPPSSTETESHVRHIHFPNPLSHNPFRQRRLRRENPRGVSDEIELRIDLSFDGLGLRLRNSGRVILRGVTGTIESGCVTAIMGAKTSL